MLFGRFGLGDVNLSEPIDPSLAFVLPSKKKLHAFELGNHIEDEDDYRDTNQMFFFLLLSSFVNEIFA